MALLPDTNLDEAVSLADYRQPDKTYKMHVDDVHVAGDLTDKIRAVEQAAYKILNTERYKHVIYSWNYGHELNELFGLPIPYCLAEIPRRIREALVVDDRIEDVTDFVLDYDKRGNVTADFVIRSIYGDISMTKGVTIA